MLVIVKVHSVEVLNFLTMCVCSWSSPLVCRRISSVFSLDMQHLLPHFSHLLFNPEMVSYVLEAS